MVEERTYLNNVVYHRQLHPGARIDEMVTTHETPVERDGKYYAIIGPEKVWYETDKGSDIRTEFKEV